MNPKSLENVTLGWGLEYVEIWIFLFHKNAKYSFIFLILIFLFLNFWISFYFFFIYHILISGVMNWEIGIVIYTLICIKWITKYSFRSWIFDFSQEYTDYWVIKFSLYTSLRLTQLDIWLADICRFVILTREITHFVYFLKWKAIFLILGVLSISSIEISQYLISISFSTQSPYWSIKNTNISLKSVSI